jgi:LemA protein
MTIGWIILGICAVILSSLVLLYNRLIALVQTRKNAFADIDVQLKLRHDLLPNLAEVVKKYASHEKSVFENVAQARSQAMQARTIDEKIKAEGVVEGSLVKLLSVAENYPALKADAIFTNFQDQLSSIEGAVAASRRFFNNSTSELNTAIQQFPAIIIARFFNFNEEAFFDVGADSRIMLDASPKVAL